MRKLTILVFTFVFFALAVNGQSSANRCETSVEAEIGAYTSYLEEESADRLHDHPVAQGYVAIERCSNKKNSYGVELWGSLSTKKNPSSATELDVTAFFKRKFSGSTSLKVSGSAYFLEQGLKIYRANATIDHTFKFTEKVEGKISNSFSVFKTNNKVDVPGGVIDTVALDISREMKRFTLTITPAMSCDNNVFRPDRNLVCMGHFTARGDISLGRGVSFFVKGGVVTKLFGETDRGFRKVAGFGFSF